MSVIDPLPNPAPCNATMAAAGRFDSAIDPTTAERIVDALAGPGWCIVPDFIPAPLARELHRALTAHREAGTFHPAGIGQGGAHALDATIRGDAIRWLDPEMEELPTALYLERLAALQQLINRQLYLGLESHETMAAIYPVGSFYRRHLDQFSGDDRRTVTAILYLNEGWRQDDGGQLRLYTGNGDEHLDIAPHAGQLVTFLSARFYHEVLPTRRERFTITTWFKRPGLL